MDLLKYLKTINFPERYVNYDIKDYLGSKSKDKVDILLGILNKPDEFISEGYKLYISGANNTQKTSIVSYFLKELIRVKSVTGWYTTMKGLYDSLVESEFDKEKNNSFMLACKLLVVDEAFDPRKLYISGKTTFQESLLDDFFRTRESDKGSVVFVSNIRKDDVGSSFGESLRHMLSRDCYELYMEDLVPPAIMNRKILEYIGNIRGVSSGK